VAGPLEVVDTGKQQRQQHDEDTGRNRQQRALPWFGCGVVGVHLQSAQPSVAAAKSQSLPGVITSDGMEVSITATTPGTIAPPSTIRLPRFERLFALFVVLSSTTADFRRKTNNAPVNFLRENLGRLRLALSQRAAV
jgi:hypothetical protein